MKLIIKLLNWWVVAATLLVLLSVLLSMQTGAFAQAQADITDPANPETPAFWKSRLADIETELQTVKAGSVAVIAVSPGGRNMYSISYGEKEDFGSQANYNSAVAAKNPAYYARKDSSTRPVVFFLGPVHGQEVEAIAGLVNLIHIAETGTDHRGKEWPVLRKKMNQCRIIIIPSANPDGRARCPYDGFVGLPTTIMTKYGQGTRRDGSFYGWPGAKAVHPMQGDVGILGAYFNDDGINPMHDDFFDPMAAETRAILDITRAEVPDITVCLHSHENLPVILQADYVPMFLKKRISQLSERLRARYAKEGLPYGKGYKPRIEDETFPPKRYFNLVSAMHQISGTMAFTFECSHGSVSDRRPTSPVNYQQILDVQLCLYEEMIDFVLEKRLFWQKRE
jgi:hypothetical protein